MIVIITNKVKTHNDIIQWHSKLVYMYVTAFDPCKSKPCQNNGFCSIMSSGFNCNCRGSYVGTRCQSKYWVIIINIFVKSLLIALFSRALFDYAFVIISYSQYHYYCLFSHTSQCHYLNDHYLNKLSLTRILKVKK